MRLTILAALALALVSTSASPAFADRRAFTHTYEYMTMPEGETELEIYSTQTKQTFGDDPTRRTFDLQLEIEHGITQRWDVSLYHVFAQSSGPAAEDNEPLHFKEIKLRTRYRFSDRGEWPVDVLVYGEGKKSFGENVWVAEGKVILARDIGELTVVANLIGESKFAGSLSDPEIEAGWAGGVTYEVVPEWKAGVESWGGFEVEHADEYSAYVGPAISWAPSSGFWATVTPGFGLNDRSDDLDVRVLLGMHLQ